MILPHSNLFLANTDIQTRFADVAYIPHVVGSNPCLDSVMEDSKEYLIGPLRL